MSNEADHSPWAPRETRPPAHPRVEPTGVDGAWAPPPARAPAGPPPASPAEPRVEAEVVPTVHTGPVEAQRAPRPAWLGRGVALFVAACLLGGGGWLALAAGTARAGADSPEAALRGALDALAAEDLVGAAEYVEPVERELLAEAGFAVADELSRLGVLAADLDLASIDGIDLEIADLRLSTATVAPGIAHVYIDGGRWVGSVDVAALPLGPLVVDRAPADWLIHTDSVAETIDRVERPVVAVERDGRWYLSLWYSVAENLRLDAGQPMPDPQRRPAPVGAESPEAAVEAMVAAAVDLDLAAALALLDPEEGAVLYDYAPLLLPEGQAMADQLEEDLRNDGWTWAVTDLSLSTESDGDVATVAVEGMRFDASAPGREMRVAFDDTTLTMSVDDGETSVDMTSDGNCTTAVFEDQWSEPSEERFCLDELGGDLFGGITASVTSLPQAGIVTHEVDGRWYVSPTRTGTEALLGVLRGLDPATLESAVDGLIDLAEDPFGSSFVTPPAVPVLPPPTTTFRPRTVDHLDLLRGERPLFSPRDLDGADVIEELRFWAPAAPDIGYARGFQASVPARNISVSSPNELVVVIAEAAGGVDPGAIETLVPADLVEDGAFPYVRGDNGWGPFVAARIPEGLVLVGTYDGWTDELLTVLAEQLENR